MNSILPKVMFVASILLFIIVQGCSEITEQTGKDYWNEIVPLAVGNQWNYSNEIYDTTGNVMWNNNTTSTSIGD